MKTPAIYVQRGNGKNRDPWLIRRFLGGIGLSMSNIAERAHTKPNVVSDTLRGIRNHRRTLEILESLGCPPDLLYPHRETGRVA